MSVPVTFPGWPKGVDNTHLWSEIPADALRAAVNMDITDSGKLRTRKGSTQAISSVGAHSLWSHHLLNEGYYASGGTIYTLSKSGIATAVVTGLSPSAKVAYAHVNGDVVWSNSVVSGKISGGVSKSFGVETPSRTSDVSATTGALPAGRYQFATTFRSASGEEGGIRDIVPITLSVTGGVVLSNMPPALSADVTHRCLYATMVHGDALFRVATLPVAVTSFTVADVGAQTVVLRTKETQPMPPGEILAHRNDMTYVAAGNVIIHSEPMRFGQCNLKKNFYLFAKPVTIMLAAAEGIYVCADKTYLIENPGTPDVVLRTLKPYGGARGTGVYLPDDTGVAWLSPQGQVIVVGGQLSVPAEKVYVPGEVASGASLVREQEGIRQIINVAHASESNPLEFTGA